MAEYGSLVLSNISLAQEDQLERLQRRAARICLRIPLFVPTHHSSLLHRLGLHTMSSRRRYRRAILGHALAYGTAPPHLQQSHLYARVRENSHNLRHGRVFQLPITRTLRHRDSPINLAAFDFNSLPHSLQNIDSATAFKEHIAPFLLSSICVCSSHPNPGTFSQ